MKSKPFLLSKQEPRKQLTEIELEKLAEVAGGVPDSAAVAPDTLCEDKDQNPKWDD